jgi:hypothetical protein
MRRNLYTAAAQPVHGRGWYYPSRVIRLRGPAAARFPSRGIFHAQRRTQACFVLAATNHGTMITNRFDYRTSEPKSHTGIGVGYQVLESGAFGPVKVERALQLIEVRHQIHGDGVVAGDGGANIGAHTIEWAIAMTG